MELGWLAWLLQVLDEQADKKHMWIRPRLEMKPSEFFRRQGWITFIDDPVALRCLDFVGAETLLWGSDYPPVSGREGYRNALMGVKEYPAFDKSDEIEWVMGKTALKVINFYA